MAPPEPSFVFTVLWSLATVGFLAAGFGLLHVRGLAIRWRFATVLATMASIVLLLVYTPFALLLGLLADVLVLVLVLGADPHGGVAAPMVFDSDRPERHPVLARLAQVVVVAFLAYVGVATLLRPWFLTWGTTREERLSRLPGDELVPKAQYRVDHAITIDAPAEAVWPWLVQLGQDRGGFYSYDWLEQAIGDQVHNADRIHPEWQHLAVGDLVRATQPNYLGGRFGQDLGWRVRRIDVQRDIVLDGWGAFVLIPVDAGTTRLYVRTRGENAPTLRTLMLAPFSALVFEPAHFLMERAMLRGIKARAERR